MACCSMQARKLLLNTYQPSPGQVNRSSPCGRSSKKTRDRQAMTSESPRSLSVPSSFPALAPVEDGGPHTY